jgi:microcystin-dependent protein
MVNQSNIQLRKVAPANVPNATPGYQAVFMTDGSSSTNDGELYKKDQSGVVTPIQGSTPIGSIVMWATNTPPTGWLICDGTTFSAGTYPLLNTVLGGTTLPNLQDRVPVGKSGTKTILSSSGSATATLASANLPAHTHAVSITSNAESAVHTHNANNPTFLATNNPSTTGTTTDNGGLSFASGLTTGRFNHTLSGGVTTDTESSTHTHAVSGNTDNGPGSATAFSVQNPYLALNFIIRAA